MNFFGRSKKKAPSSGGGGGGGGSKPSNTDPSSALQTVRSKIQGLEKRVEFLEKKAHANLVEAKRYSQAKNKRSAMQALKRKKMHEKEVDKLRTAIMNLEEQAFSIENASTTIDIVSGMQVGRDAAKQIQKEINIDKVEDLKDDIEEHMQNQREVDDILSNPMGTEYDDDDLMAELDELDADEEDELAGLDEEVSNVSIKDPPPAYVFPDAPSGHVQVNKPIEVDEDAQALAALEAEMAM